MGLRWERLCVSMVAVCLCLVLYTNQASAEPLRLVFMNYFDSENPHTKVMQAWINDLEKRFSGRIKINFSHESKVISAPQTYSAVRHGYVDIGITALQYTRSLFPVMEVVSLPLGFSDSGINTAVVNEVYDKFKPAEFDQVKVLYFMPSGPAYFHTKGYSVQSFDDLKGRHIHSNGAFDKSLSAFGVTHVSIPMTRLPGALEKGTITGGQWDFSASYNWHLAQYVDYDIVCDEIASSAGLFVFMNKQAWEELDPDIRNYIEQKRPMWAANHGRAWAAGDARGLAYSQSQGNTIIKVTPEEGAKWRSALQGAIDDYILKTESLGLPGRDVVNFVEKRLGEAKKGDFVSEYILN